MKTKFEVGGLTILIFVLGLRFGSEIKLGSQFSFGQEVKLRYCLTNQPYYNWDSQIFYYQNHFQQLKIIADLEKRYDFGDCLEIKGKIEACFQPSRSKYCLLNPDISTYRPPIRINFLTKLRNVRQILSDFYLENMPYPYSDLLAGIVLGVEKDLDQDFYNQLRETGTLHIIVASGYNLTVSAQKPADLLSYLIGRNLALIFGIIFVWLYVSMVGWQPPVVRAGLMLTSIFLAQLVGRKFYQARSLFFIVWLMLMFKPDLIVSISFQLSFAALIGIIIGTKIFGGLKKIPVIGGDLAETLSAQLLVTPIIAYHFGRLSFLAPVTNALILPLVPKITWAGISALLGLFWPGLGRLILLIIFPLLWWPVVVVRWFGQLPITEVGLPLPFWGVIIFYLAVFLVFHIKLTIGKKSKRPKSQLSLFS